MCSTFYQLNDKKSDRGTPENQVYEKIHLCKAVQLTDAVHVQGVASKDLTVLMKAPQFKEPGSPQYLQSEDGGEDINVEP